MTRAGFFKSLFTLAAAPKLLAECNKPTPPFIKGIGNHYEGYAIIGQVGPEMIKIPEHIIKCSDIVISYNRASKLHQK